MQHAQLTARLDPQLTDQDLPRVAIGLQRLGLATSAVQREHPLGAQALPQRMLARHQLQLRHQPLMAPQRQIRIDAVLQRRHARLLQAGDLTLRERLIGEIRKRRAAPQAERLPQPRSRRGRVTARKRSAPLGGKPLELLQVNLACRR